jgi:hypothetical protein
LSANGGATEQSLLRHLLYAHRFRELQKLVGEIYFTPRVDV